MAYNGLKRVIEITTGTITDGFVEDGWIRVAGFSKVHLSRSRL